MANLSSQRARRSKKVRIIFSITVFLIGTFFVPYASNFLIEIFKNRFQINNVKVSYFGSWHNLFYDQNHLYCSAIFEILVLLGCFLILTYSWNVAERTNQIFVTDQISIPMAVGEGQHGSARFMSVSEKENCFTKVRYNGQMNDEYRDMNLGFVLGMEKKRKTENIYCITEDVHTMIIGSTRSGKTRRSIYETIWLRSFCDKSFVVSDPKGELYLSTNPFLKEKDYNVIVYDFREPLKSMHYNYLYFINKALIENDIPTAIDYTWDLVSVMVGEPKGEPLWTNGEASVIAASILAVCMEAPEEYRNLTNVYYFIANMCKEDDMGEMPINRFFQKLPSEHPAIGVFGVAGISPDRTRGSFFGSALATLRLFTNWNISDMTSKNDYDIENIGRQKTAVFIIVNDEKDTLYSLVSIMINQMYVSLVKVANEYGGRLPVEVEFILDEFGNFPVIPSFGPMLTVGAGRGIRFDIVLQDYQQLEKKYEKDFNNIKGNCLNLVYLKTPSFKTREEISKCTGTYTVQVNSVNSSVSGLHKKNVSYSDSANMSSRALLMPDEIGRFENPYSLVLFSGKFPAVMYSPDLSKYYANEEFGLGDKKHNQKLMLDRNNERSVRERATLKLWKIWEEYAEHEDEDVENENSSNDYSNSSYL